MRRKSDFITRCAHGSQCGRVPVPAGKLNWRHLACAAAQLHPLSVAEVVHRTR